MDYLKKILLFTIVILLLLTAACGGGSAPTPTPTPTPTPNPTPNPTPTPTDIGITILTPFPASTKNSTVDVTYEATPGSGASVTEVYYSINGGAAEYIYLRAASGVDQKGSLTSAGRGNARVMLVPGNNSIVFTVKDSAGKTAGYNVSNTPFYDFGTDLANLPSYDEALLGNVGAPGGLVSTLATDPGIRFVTNRILVFAKSGVTDAQVTEAVEAIGGGVIVGQVNALGMYWIEFSGKYSENQLLGFCGQIKTAYPNRFKEAVLDTVSPVEVPSPDSQVRSTGVTNDPWWDYTDDRQQWGLTAMNVPEVWSAYGSKLHDIKIGIIDSGLNAVHEDLKIPAGNVINRDYDDHNHGTHVMGTIGAVHGNGKGLTGVMNINGSSLYSYDIWNPVPSDAEILTGLAWSVTNGAKIINVSIGLSWPGVSPDPYLAAPYISAMNVLLDDGYDFVVVNSAGNYWIDASRNGTFALIDENHELRKRIISVGAVDKFGEMAFFSNYGSIVDVVAPGVDIYSSVASNNNSSYDIYNGTSMAAPHVTGVAGLVWAINPGLTGDQVKEIIVETARSFGLAVNDSRLHVPSDSWLTYYMVNAKAAVDMAKHDEPELVSMRLIGRVISEMSDGTDGPAVTGAGVSLYSGSANGTLFGATETNANGYYVMEAVPVGQYVLKVEANGYISEQFAVQIEADNNTTRIHRLKSDFIEIRTPDELNSIRNDLSGNYKLAADISLATYANWVPIGAYAGAPFTGKIDGNGYKITGLKINMPTEKYVGLFAYINNGTISNLALEGVDITGGEHAGAVAGCIAGNTIITDSSTSGDIRVIAYSNANRAVAGGIVGVLNPDGATTTIIKSSSSANISASSTYNTISAYAGGMTGWVYSTFANGKILITDSYSMGNISASSNSRSNYGASYAGGIVGDVLDVSVGGISIITGSFSMGNINASAGSDPSYAGGIAGRVGSANSSNTITGSYSIGSVNASGRDASAGGIAGHVGIGAGSNNTITNSYSMGTISSSSSASSNDSASSYSGGIAGRVGVTGISNNNKINNSYSTGDIDATSLSFGGGAWPRAGGIAGFVITGAITDSYSSGNINASHYNRAVGSSYAGGIVGDASGNITITGCAAINKNIIAGSLTGSFVGMYNVGRVTGSALGNAISNNFALNVMTVSGGAEFKTDVRNHGVDKTEPQLKTQSTYSSAVNGDGFGGLGWKFGTNDDNPWKMPSGGGYPIFYWQ